MKNLRERWHGLTVLGVVAFAAACMTVAPAPSFADIAGGGGGGGGEGITEWCSDGRPISYWGYDGWNGTQNEQMFGPLTRYSVECNAGGTAHRDFLVGLNSIDQSASRTDSSVVTSRPAGTYYFNKDGLMQTGLVWCEDGSLRYFDLETGAMVTNQWHNEYEAVWYYFGADGTAVSGWQSIGGDKYYFYPENHDMAYGRVQIDGKNYFLNTPGANADGRMQHSGWFYDSIYGKWSYATSDGELLTGWHNLGGAWYYFNESGVMLTGWINDSGTWYYTNASGAMVTGWLNIGGTWFYLDGSGAMVANSWRSLGGSWYCSATPVQWPLAGSWQAALGTMRAVRAPWQPAGSAMAARGIGSEVRALWPLTLGLTLVEFGTGSTIPVRWPPAGVRSAAPGTTLAVPALWLTTPGSATTTSSLPVPWLRMPGLAPTMSARTASGFRATA